MNIILLVIDTLRHDAIGVNGSDYVETPNIDRLADGAWAFDSVFCASYPTIPCRNDLMKGTYGAPFHPWRPLRHDAVTFPRLLSDAGYCTQLIHDTPHLVNGGHNFDWPFNAWTFVRGAEVDRPWVQGDVTWPDNWGHDPLFDSLGDDALNRMYVNTYCWANRNRKTYSDWHCMGLFETASAFLTENAGRDNFFLWIDCFDPHEPWDAPPEFILKYDRTPGYDGRIDPRSLQQNRNDERLPTEARERIKLRYPAKTTWMDHCLGVFLDTLETTGLADNTAVILIGDHGTNVGERGQFGKGYPVREQEGHVPLFIRVPGDSGGRCSAIVQPQDIFATVFGLAGLQPPGQIDSHDVLGVAREGNAGHREIALAGNGADTWPVRHMQDPSATLFTAFDADWALEVTAAPEDCRLWRLGSLDEVSNQHPNVVQGVHRAAIDEVERRGTDPALVAWLRGGCEGQPPDDCRYWDGWPGPAGFTTYWSRIYQGE